MHTPSRKSLILMAIIALVAAGPALAQTNPTEHRQVPYRLSSGSLDNLAETSVVVFDKVVSIDDAPWVRLAFSRVELGDGSYLRLTSLWDGAVQTMRPIHVDQWQNTSAYFNGPDVRIELIAGSGSRGNNIDIDRVYAGMMPTAPESQCGPVDDRVASNEPARARLLDIGCTAAVYHENSCFITAGHCSVISLMDVVEFQVPLSNGNGSLNHPGPEDQYAVDTSTSVSVNGGVGNDWGLFKVFPNTQTGLMPFEAQGARVNLAGVGAPVGDDVRIVGYGVDGGTANQTQQESFGPITFSSATTLQYQADTEGGNSGSSVEHVQTGDIVAIHTHGGCSTGGGSGANSGTAITNAGLQAALNGYCDGGGMGIPCADIDRVQARCVVKPLGNALQMRVVLTDASHDGETVTFNVDGADRVGTVVGNQARVQVNNAASGTHTIELVDPVDCAPRRTVVCE